MKPVLIMPMNDLNGSMFGHLQTLTPLLKTLFAQTFVSIPATTYRNQQEHVAWLQTEEFFKVLYHDTDPPIGEDFATLYRQSAQACDPNQLLHLCFIDRLAFILQTEHREQFINDIHAVHEEDTPLIFQRSPVAWDTHPTNYFEIEQMITKVGELLFEQTLDFAWCHLVAKANQLNAVLEHIDNPNLSMMAEIVIGLRDTIHTQNVNWLAWEDPFITSSDPQQLKVQRETSKQETLKRLSYALPMLQLLYGTVKDRQ